MLILAFEANSALSRQNGLFSLILAHCDLDECENLTITNQVKTTFLNVVIVVVVTRSKLELIEISLK